MGIPSEAARASILRVLTRPLRLSGGFDFGEVAKRTPGFVGADLQVGSNHFVARCRVICPEGVVEQAEIEVAKRTPGCCGADLQLEIPSGRSSLLCFVH